MVNVFYTKEASHWFPDMRVPIVLLPPQKHWIFGTFCPMPNQKTMWTRCPGGFSVMWVTKVLISPVKKRIFCPKTTKFGPKLAFLVNFGQAMQAYSMPCCGSVSGCGARAVSRKTPIYFIIIAFVNWIIVGIFIYALFIIVSVAPYLSHVIVITSSLILSIYL